MILAFFEDNRKRLSFSSFNNYLFFSCNTEHLFSQAERLINVNAPDSLQIKLQIKLAKWQLLYYYAAQNGNNASLFHTPY